MPLFHGVFDNVFNTEKYKVGNVILGRNFFTLLFTNKLNEILLFMC